MPVNLTGYESDRGLKLITGYIACQVELSFQHKGGMSALLYLKTPPTLQRVSFPEI